jgi:hypothetical protein
MAKAINIHATQTSDAVTLNYEASVIGFGMRISNFFSIPTEYFIFMFLKLIFVYKS